MAAKAVYRELNNKIYKKSIFLIFSYMGAGSLQIRKKYSHGMQEHFPLQAKPSPGFSKKQHFIYFSNIVSDPQFSQLNLAKQPSSRGRHTHQNVRNVQHTGTDGHAFSNEFGRVELSHFPSENVEKHPKSPTYQMWNEYNVFLKNTLLKISVYYI